MRRRVIRESRTLPRFPGYRLRFVSRLTIRLPGSEAGASAVGWRIGVDSGAVDRLGLPEAGDSPDDALTIYRTGTTEMLSVRPASSSGPHGTSRKRSAL